MGKNFKNSSDWNEFEWEMEIRSEEERIRRYFNTLPNCLDLPNEEESIATNLAISYDLIPQIDPQRPGWSYTLGRQDDYENGARKQQTQETEIVLAIQKLAYEWNILKVSLSHPSFTADLQMSCLLGDLMARCADMAELGKSLLPKLQLSLGKRILKKINILVGKLQKLLQSNPELHTEIETFCSQAQHIRERVVDIVNELKANNDEK